MHECGANQKWKLVNLADAVSVHLYTLPFLCTLSHLSIASKYPQSLLWLCSWEAGSAEDIMPPGNSLHTVTLTSCVQLSQLICPLFGIILECILYHYLDLLSKTMIFCLLEYLCLIMFTLLTPFFALPYFSSVQFSRSVMSDSLRPHGMQHTRPPCPSPTPGVYPNSCPLSR